MAVEYVDIDITMSPQAHGPYSVAVRSDAGEAQAEAAFPFTDAQLEGHLLRLENAILRSAGQRRQRLTPEEQAIQEFGRQLFDFAFPGEVRTVYDLGRAAAAQAGKGLRVRLRIRAPQLAALPWEFLYDARSRDYLCLDANTPVVRYVELAQPVRPLSVTPPLRILGMVASPAGLAPIDVEPERSRVQQALAGLVQAGQVELAWVGGQTSRDLQRSMRAGPWHVFHLVSHGGYDPQRDQGVVVLADDNGQRHEITAQQLSRILAGQRPALRLVVLNACEGARAGMEDVFSSTATTLMLSGVPAVLAMQYSITSAAAVEFAQAFYKGIAAGQPVDGAVTEGRNAISLRVAYSLEWGTPVLYMRSPDGVLFNFNIGPRPRRIPVWALIVAFVALILFLVPENGNWPSWPTSISSPTKTSSTFTPIDPSAAEGYLEQVFVLWTLAGDLRDDSETDKHLLSAFHSLLLLHGDSRPSETMRVWIENAKGDAVAALPGTEISDYGYLEYDTAGPFEVLMLEESYRRLWEHALKESNSNSASNMAAIRLALIASVGEDRQREFLDSWGN